MTFQFLGRVGATFGARKQKRLSLSQLPEQGKNSWKIEIVSPKKVSEILNGMPDKVKKAMYQMLKPKFASSASSGRKKINLPSKEELQAERQSLSVAQLAKKYNCSVTTINRRLGLIKKKG